MKTISQFDKSCQEKKTVSKFDFLLQAKLAAFQKEFGRLPSSYDEISDYDRVDFACAWENKIRKMALRAQTLQAGKNKPSMLERVLTTKRAAFVAKYNRLPSEQELDAFGDWQFQARKSGKCYTGGRYFYSILTGKSQRFTCSRIRCACPHCVASYLRLRAQRVDKAVKEHDLNRMITLTLDPSCITGKTKDEKICEAARIISGLVTRFKRALKYLLCSKLKQIDAQTLAIVHWIEPHKNSLFPHVHLLINWFVDCKQLDRIARKYGFGNNDISFVNAQSIGGYASKRLSKIAYYAAKPIESSMGENDESSDDEKYFDSRFLEYFSNRSRLIGYTRNIKAEKKNGMSQWIIADSVEDLISATPCIPVEDKPHELKICRAKYATGFIPVHSLSFAKKAAKAWNYLREPNDAISVNDSFKSTIQKYEQEGRLEEIFSNLEGACDQANIEICFDPEKPEMGKAILTQSGQAHVFGDWTRKKAILDGVATQEQIQDFVVDSLQAENRLLLSNMWSAIEEKNEVARMALVEIEYPQ